MKKIVVLLILLWPHFTFAGEIYGSIRDGGRLVGKGVRIDIIIGGKTYSTKTDAYGSYRLYTREQGKCTLKVHYKGQSPIIKIYSYKRSVGYDLILKKRDGRYYLRRK